MVYNVIMNGYNVIMVYMLLVLLLGCYWWKVFKEELIAREKSFKFIL